MKPGSYFLSLGKILGQLFISQSIELHFYPRAHTNVSDQNTHKLSIRNPQFVPLQEESNVTQLEPHL